jgi:hypothetical protein
MERRLSFGSIATAISALVLGGIVAVLIIQRSESRSNIPSDRPTITDFNQRR